MIEFFFDCSSPWTYLAFHNIQPLAKEFGAEISWRPILVGGIFNTVNPSVYASREKPVPLKARYMKKDLADWARSAGLAIKMPPTVFPVNSVKAMRGCIWLGKDMVPFARAVFESYWGGDKDISQNAVLTEICKSLSIDPQKFLAGIGEQAIKDQLKANTDEVMARGGFGSPTIFVDKTGCFLPKDMRGRSRVVQWVMWQMSGLGPMLGQHGHFALYAPAKIAYAIERYRDEAARLYRVLDTQLGKTGRYVAGDYSIADIACFPWTMTHKAQGFTLDDYPNVKRWYAEVRARPQVQAGLAIGKFEKEPFDEEARKNMFGQRAKEMAKQNDSSSW